MQKALGITGYIFKDQFMKNFIIGTGGFSKEVYSVMKQNDISFDGFVGLDTTPISIGTRTYIPILEQTFLNTDDNKKNCNLYIGIGNPKILKIIKQKYTDYNFPNLIDKNCHITGEVEMGYGNILCSGTVFTTNIKVGSFNIFNLNCTIGHDCRIGSFNVFNPTCCISGNVTIRDSNLFGVNSAVLENLNIESENIIGAMGLVTKNIDTTGNTYIGIPAKRK